MGVVEVRALRLSSPHRGILVLVKDMAHPTGFEPVIPGFVDRCLIQFGHGCAAKKGAYYRGKATLETSSTTGFLTPRRARVLARPASARGPTSAGISPAGSRPRDTDPKNVERRRGLSGLDSIVGNRNDATIASVMDESDHVILAWGARSGINEDDYCRRIGQVAQILHPHRRKLWHVKTLTKDDHPRHALQWGYTSQRAKISPNWRWLSGTAPAAGTSR